MTRPELAHSSPYPALLDTPPRLAAIAVDIRALPDSPSGAYAPKVADCPSTRPKIRLADGLSVQEAAWLRLRRNKTADPLHTLLSRANIPDFNASAYIDGVRENSSALPNIAVAVSGGGYRALMNGAGFISAADSRNNESGLISGLLQASTYLAGLSGGGWLVGSMFTNNFTSVPDLQQGDKDSAVWRFDRCIFEGPEESGIGVLNTVEYWTQIGDAVGKKASGWNTSITDYWGRSLSYQLVNASEGGPAYTFSSIADTPNFKDASTPFPILIADGRAPGERVISLNATVYEFNPYGLGTWDPTTYGFAPLRSLASNFSNGVISASAKCVRGFDQLGFVMGTSSSLFNQFLLQNISSLDDVPSFVTKTLEGILNGLDKDDEDIAQYSPNPFLAWDPTRRSANANDSQLTLVNGGEDLQNIPLHPLIQPVRNVDIIFAVDSSADTDTHWPNGTALRATYDRVGTSIGNGTLFPSVPSAETFINQRLNQRPTLFGCDADNFTLSGDQSVPPLVLYIPNAPYTAHSNVSTFDMSYPTDQRDSIIQNGLNAATQGNGTVDEEWPVCVACAILSRSWWKGNETVPEACTRCFARYCWDGTSNDTAVKSYNPDYIIGENQEAKDSTGVMAMRPTWALTAGIGITAFMALTC